MHVNDIGSWCVMWFTAERRLAHAFFSSRSHALAFQAWSGGELYEKLTDGTLKRNG